MGITSLLIAEADAARVKEGKPRAVKAVWADIPMADAYRDVTFQGGSVDSGFIPLWLGLVTSLSDLPPASANENPQEAAQVYIEHLLGNAEFSVTHILGAALGEEDAYDGPFYRLRSPVVRASEITVPVVIQGGWWDLFQRGEPLLWESLKNSKDRVLFMSAHYHVSSGPEYEDPNIKEEWFSHWLKGTKNNVQKTPKVNLYPINGTHWEHFKKFPLPKSSYQRLYLNGDSSGSAPLSAHDGSLASAPPKTESGDTAPLLPASSPCSRETAQWTAGLGSNSICDTTNNTYEASSLTYTTAPLASPEKIEGLLKTNLWANISTSDATLVAVLSEVEPDGKSEQITAGFLQASLRATDPSLATYGPKHVVTRPWHPFTKESQQAVTPNQPTEYEVEIYPTGVVVPAGDRLRLTIGTANTFTGTPTLPTLGQELGGTITLLHGGGHDSYVQLPVVRRGGAGGEHGPGPARPVRGGPHVARPRLAMCEPPPNGHAPAPAAQLPRARGRVEHHVREPHDHGRQHERPEAVDEKPPTIASVRSSISIATKNHAMPSVRIASGKVMKSRSGLRIVFSTPKTAAAAISEPALLTCTFGSSATTSRARAR